MALLGRQLRGATRIRLGLCSPARRTRETLEILIADQWPDLEIETPEELYLADASTLLRRLRAVGPGTDGVLLVGHNPGLFDLVTLLARGAAKGFPPASAVAFEIDGPLSALGAGTARLAGIHGV